MDRNRSFFVQTLLVLGTWTAFCCGSFAQQRAAEYDLRPSSATPKNRDVTATLEVRGFALIPDKDRKMVRRPLSADGKVSFSECVLATTSIDRRRVRFYESASADVAVDQRKLPAKTLAKDRRLIVAQSAKNGIELSSPYGPLSRDDLDLVSLPGDPLAFDALLPEQAVKIHDRWELRAEALAPLLALDVVHSATIECELKEVENDRALVEFSGTANGVEGGGKTEVTLSGKFTVDVSTRLMTWLALSIQEKRELGFVGPGLDTAARLVIETRATKPSERLTDRALAGLKLDPSADDLTLQHIASGRDGRFELNHDRRWHVVSEDNQSVGLRLVDGDDLIAQLNLALLDRRNAGTSQSLEEFQAGVQKVLGKSFGQFLRVGQYQNQQGYRVYRVEAIGKTNDLDILWLYYYVADTEGRNAALVFTLESKFEKTLDGADKTIVDNLVLADQPGKDQANATQPNADPPNTNQSNATKPKTRQFKPSATLGADDGEAETENAFREIGVGSRRK